MADGGEYRYRRFSEFTYNNLDKSLNSKPHSYFIQPNYLNHLNGGIKRYFHPLTPYVAMNQELHKFICLVGNIISCINGNMLWKLYVHQVSILASKDQLGSPAPEGIHKDGMTFSVLLLIDRNNINGGVNKFYNNDKELIDEVTLLDRYDFIIMDDRKGYHSVSDISVIETTNEGKRSMLFLEFSEDL